ncbi:Methyltransferase [Burkholderiales bacterium]|nr:Methyltransferase [Burkholderiales bacterium]
MKKTARPATPGARPARAGGPAGRVRIIGGQYRRTPIAVILAPGLRPTPDRVRETVFNWLEHLLGGLMGGRALDLFAGSGALGLEMASRGAARVVLVESNARAAEALRGLQRRLAASAVEVLHADWQSVVGRWAPASFDVIFLDPPFGSDVLAHALDAVRPLLAPGGLIYVESPAPPDAARLAQQGLELARTGQAGVVYFHLLRARSC